MISPYTGPLTPIEWQTIAETRFQMRRAGVNLAISRLREQGVDPNLPVKRKRKGRKNVKA